MPEFVNNEVFSFHGMLLLFLIFVFCERNLCGASNVDFKCAAPDLTSTTNLDVGKFTNNYAGVSEVKFPGLVGPLNERLICKIKCIDGNWVGPLCSTKDGRFQPLFRECIYGEENPLLVLSYKNSTIKNGTMSHGAVVTVRCKQLGVYKLKGDSLSRCHNGEWMPRLPDCIPTTLVTNFTGDAPPSITYNLTSGSAWVEHSGELWVYPESLLFLECVSLKTDQDPVWSWTQVLAHHPSEWSPIEEESTTHYRLSLGKVSARHSDQYTCSTPNGKTNTVTIKVVNVVCPQLDIRDERVIQSDEGIRLGQSIHLSCKPGFQINGSVALTCTGSGVWSDRPPSCVETFCPMLKWSSPHLSLLEYNSSAGGRAVFQCAWGYKVIGYPTVECDIKGRWVNKLPECAAVHCQTPVLPENGFVTKQTEERHAVGDLIVYGCSQQRRMVGESSVVCTESGVWSHPPPLCLESVQGLNETDQLVTTPDVIYIDNMTLTEYQFP